MLYSLGDFLEVQVISEKENEFFKRKDLRAVVKHANAPTPAKAEIVKLLAEKYSVDSTQVAIDYIFTKKGVAESLVKAKILKEKPKVEEVQKKEEKSETQTGASSQTS
jgi:ribosomal protein S24E